MNRIKVLAIGLVFLMLIAVPGIKTFAETPKDLGNSDSILITPNTVDWGDTNTNTPSDNTDQSQDKKADDEAIADKILTEFNEDSANSEIADSWGYGFHYTITYNIAVNEGYFSTSDANQIAMNDHNVDNVYTFVNRYHFNVNSPNLGYVDGANDSRNILFWQYMTQAINYENSGQHAQAMQALGTALHPRQDIFAHYNCQNMTQHQSVKHDGANVIDDFYHDVVFDTVASDATLPLGVGYHGTNRKQQAEQVTRDAFSYFLSQT